MASSPDAGKQPLAMHVDIDWQDPSKSLSLATLSTDQLLALRGLILGNQVQDVLTWMGNKLGDALDLIARGFSSSYRSFLIGAFFKHVFKVYQLELFRGVMAEVERRQIGLVSQSRQISN